MRSYFEKIEKLRIGWNRRPLSEDDFHRICRRFRITVVEMPLRTNGFYYCVKRRNFIAIDSKLPPTRKLLVMFHELAHFLMHAPETNTTASFHGIGRKNRKEREADAFALCAIIPKPLLEARSLGELLHEGLCEDILRERLEVLARFGV